LLLKFSERVQSPTVRQGFQKNFESFISKFEPVASFLLLSRVIELVIKREIILSIDLNEPQVLGWMIDQFRRKAFSHNQSATCRMIFQDQLSVLYHQIYDIVYEDMVSGLNFYLSVTQLIYAHSLSKTKPLILCMANEFLKRYSAQLSDYQQLLELKKKIGQLFDHDSNTKLLFLKNTLKDTSDYMCISLLENK